MSWHQSIHLNRILNNVALGPAMIYISSCESFFQALHSVSSGFGVYDSDLLGKYFIHNVPVEIEFSGQHLLQFGPQSSSMEGQVSGSGPPASGHSVFIGTFLTHQISRDRTQTPPLRRRA
jgi:hypothetical protein